MMTKHIRIMLKNLIVNPANDRHGDVGTEAGAIEWLLVNKTEKMKDLLEDIVSKRGEVVEEPLVMPIHGTNQYMVYDGNRRVTCLKLLSGLAPAGINNPLDKKIIALRENSGELPLSVECRVETDINVINDILELRHTPGNSGAGQLKWDGHEKENFLERTGRSNQPNFAREVNRILVDSGHLNETDRLPLSTFNRLFSSRENRRRVGIDTNGNEIVFINERDAVCNVLSRIAKDMIAKRKTLDDVWDNDKKTAYLDELETEQLLPSAKNRLASPEPVEDAVGTARSGNRKPLRPLMPQHERDYLLPTNLPTPVQNTYFSNKFCQLFYELQNTLRFSHHLISMSITMRPFLEILTGSYLRAHGLPEGGSLSVKVKTAFADTQSKQTMPEEARAFIHKLNDDSEYFSINTLHKVTHNDMQISAGDLRSFVNNMDAYFRVAIEAVNTKDITKAA